MTAMENKPEDFNPNIESNTTEDGLLDHIKEKSRVILCNLMLKNSDRTIQIRDITSRILSTIQSMQNKPENMEHIITSIASCQNIKNDEEFKEAILKILDPLIIDISKEREKFARLNGILTYGIYEKGNLVHIHIEPDLKTNKLPPTEKKKLLLEGFQQLAKIIEDTEYIKKITAISSLIARSPKFITSLGFSEPIPSSEEEIKKHFYYEYENNIPVGYSEIERDDFLTRYLKK